MAKKATKKHGHGITLLTADGEQSALRFAGAGSLSDLAKMAHAEGGSVTLTPEEAACYGAGFVPDLMKADLADPDTPPPGDVAPTLTSLSPNTAVLGDPDFTLICLGTGFNDTTIIVFSDQDEPTTLISDTQVSTGVKPSLGWGAVSLPVYVKNGVMLQSEALQFTFTEPAARSGKIGGGNGNHNRK